MSILLLRKNVQFLHRPTRVSLGLPEKRQQLWIWTIVRADATRKQSVTFLDLASVIVGAMGASLSLLSKHGLRISQRVS